MQAVGPRVEAYFEPWPDAERLVVIGLRDIDPRGHRGEPDRLTMHLLAGDVGRIEDGDAAVDLDQSPGDIVVLSSADSELALLAEVAKESGEGAPTLRLANLMRLGHPLSVDLYVEKTRRHAKLVVVRLMGGVELLALWARAAARICSWRRAKACR